MTPTPKPPLTTTTSILPAMAVVGIAVVTLVVFLLINFIANPKVTTTTTTLPVVVGGLLEQPNSRLLAGCQEAGNPPANIGGALLVPRLTRSSGPTLHPNGGAGDYDCLRTLVTRTSPAQLLGFYSAQLQSRGWSLFSKGSPAGLPQYLFQKAGSDTFYWIIGITVNATHGLTSAWTFRIYQNSSAI